MLELTSRLPPAPAPHKRACAETPQDCGHQAGPDDGPGLGFAWPAQKPPCPAGRVWVGGAFWDPCQDAFLKHSHGNHPFTAYYP